MSSRQFFLAINADQISLALKISIGFSLEPGGNAKSNSVSENWGYGLLYISRNRYCLKVYSAKQDCR